MEWLLRMLDAMEGPEGAGSTEPTDAEPQAQDAPESTPDDQEPPEGREPPQPIPYARFKNVNDELKRYKEESANYQKYRSDMEQREAGYLQEMQRLQSKINQPPEPTAPVPDQRPDLPPHVTQLIQDNPEAGAWIQLFGEMMDHRLKGLQGDFTDLKQNWETMSAQQQQQQYVQHINGMAGAVIDRVSADLEFDAAIGDPDRAAELEQYVAHKVATRFYNDRRWNALQDQYKWPEFEATVQSEMRDVIDRQRSYLQRTIDNLNKKKTDAAAATPHLAQMGGGPPPAPDMSDLDQALNNGKITLREWREKTTERFKKAREEE